MRARKISFGSDSVEEDIKRKKVYLVIIAKDSSERTKNRFIKLCNENNIEKIIISDIETISKKIGKNNKAIIGIKEKNIANQIQKIYNGGERIGEN